MKNHNNRKHNRKRMTEQLVADAHGRMADDVERRRLARRDRIRLHRSKGGGERRCLIMLCNDVDVVTKKQEIHKSAVCLARTICRVLTSINRTSEPSTTVVVLVGVVLYIIVLSSASSGTS